MAKKIEDFVSENRRDLRRVDATLVSVSSGRPLRLNMGDNGVNVPTSVKVYTRDLNDTLISGHPDGATHGSGHGVAGDRRGSWTLQTDTEASEELVRDGRNAIRDALAGDPNGDVDILAVGSDTTAASVADAALGSENGRVEVAGRQGATAEETVVEAQFLFAEYGDTIGEYGVISDGGSLMNRITTATIDPSEHKEILVEITFEVNGSGVGNSAVTNKGEEAIAESIRKHATVGLNKMLFGSGTSSPSKTDTALGTKEFEKNCQRVKDPEVVTGYTVVMESEPATQPHTISELGVEDNTGRLLWRADIDSFTKDDETQVEVYVGFRAK